MKSTHIRIRDVYFEYEDFRYRTPIKFGGVALDRVTLLNVRIAVEGGSGKVATGSGSMPLGNAWAFPSRVLTYDQTLGAMRFIASRVAEDYRACGLTGHPIDITHRLEPELLHPPTTSPRCDSCRSRCRSSRYSSSRPRSTRPCTTPTAKPSG